MPTPTKEEVIEFIKKNDSFFKKPLPDFVPSPDIVSNMPKYHDTLPFNPFIHGTSSLR